MKNINKLIIYYNVRYLMLMIIIEYIMSFNFLDGFIPVYIPLSYLIIRFLVIHDIEKKQIKKDDILFYLLTGFTTINIFFHFNIFYDICIVIFLIILKDKKSNQDEIIKKNLEEFYKNQKEN